MKSPRERTEFAKRMREARRDADLTQLDVQRALGISQSNLSDLENIAESSTYTAQLAKLYRVDAHWLATGKGSKRQVREEVAALMAQIERMSPTELKRLQRMMAGAADDPSTHPGDFHGGIDTHYGDDMDEDDEAKDR